MMIALISNLVLLSVIFAALAWGGRYERYAGLMFLLALIASNMAQRIGATMTPMEAYLAIDAALLGALVWLAWRTGRAWVFLAAALQAVMVGLDAARLTGSALPVVLYFRLIYGLAFLQIGCLAFAVLRRRIGPPHAPPPAGREA